MISLAELVECRDEETGGYVNRTAEYARILEIVEAGLYRDILTPEYIKDIVRSAPLHDVGKIGINDATLLKAGSLDNEEFEYMKNHSVLGVQALQNMINETSVDSFLYTAKHIAYYHHKKAIEIIMQGKGKGFDPNIIDVFEKISYKFKNVNA